MTAPFTREPFLSLRDISPRCGETPYLREPNNPSVTYGNSSLYKGAFLGEPVMGFGLPLYIFPNKKS